MWPLAHFGEGLENGGQQALPENFENLRNAIGGILNQLSIKQLEQVLQNWSNGTLRGA